MSVAELVRAWKDEDYRSGLDPADVPAHPAGDVLTETTVSADVAVGNTCEPQSCVHLCSNWN